MGVRAWVVLLTLAAAGCLQAPPGPAGGEGGGDECTGPTEPLADPLLGDVVTFTFDGDDELTDVIHDSSGNRFDGVLLVGGILDPDGVHGARAGSSGVGTAILEAPVGPLELGGGVTIELWINRGRTGTGEGLVSAYDEDTGVSALVLEILDNDGLSFGVATGDCASPDKAAATVPPEIVEIGQTGPIHLAVTWDGEQVKIYRDADLVATSALSAVPCAALRPLTIGAIGRSLRPFDGWIDDVKISSYVKSEEEIEDSMDADPVALGPRCGNRLVEESEDCELPALCCDPDTCRYAGAGCECPGECVVGLCAGGERTEDGLIALYDFDDGAGLSVADSSPTGLSLEIIGGGFSWGTGSLTVTGDTLLRSAGTATELVQACQATQEVTLEAWLVPADLDSARQTIAILGLGDACQGVALIEERDRVAAAVASELTDEDGAPRVDTPVAALAGRLVHVVVTRSADGWRRLYVDGRLVGENRVAGNLSSWNLGYRLALGGPITDLSETCEKGEADFWRGELHRVAVYDRALSAIEVAGNYQAGAEPVPAAGR